MSQLIPIALKYLNYPCKRYSKEKPGNATEGFSCSGYVNFILNEAGINLPFLHTYELFDRFGIFVHDEFKKSGDLAFFSKFGYKPSHVEFYIARTSLIEALDIIDKNIPKDDISRILVSSVSSDFTIGSHGKDDSKVTLSILEKNIIIPNEKYNHFPQLYYSNPIGYKRPAMLKKGKKYQEMLV